MSYNNDNQRFIPPITLGEWMLTMLVMIIPFVNIIMLFVWAFGDSSNPSKANWAKAQLLWFAIIIGLYVVVGVVFLGSVISLIGGLS